MLQYVFPCVSVWPDHVSVFLCYYSCKEILDIICITEFLPFTVILIFMCKWKYSYVNTSIHFSCQDCWLLKISLSGLKGKNGNTLEVKKSLKPSASWTALIEQLSNSSKTLPKVGFVQDPTYSHSKNQLWWHLASSVGKKDKTDQYLPYGPFFSHQSPHLHLSYSLPELSPFISAEGVYVKETSLYNHTGANVTVTLTAPDLGPFAAAPPWGGWFLLCLSLSITWLWQRALSPLLCKGLAAPSLLPGASVTQSSICSLHCSLHTQPPALNVFLKICYKRNVSHAYLQQFHKRGLVGLHLLSELQPSIRAVWTTLYLKLGKVPWELFMCKMSLPCV